MIDEISILFHCNKKSKFSSSYEFDMHTLGFTGTYFYANFISDTSDEDRKKINEPKKWNITIYESSKKIKDRLIAFPKTEEDGSLLTCEFGLNKDVFNRLETNLVNNGMDFLKNIKFQVRAGIKGFKKSKDNASGWTILDLKQAKVIFASNWDDDED